MRTKNILATFCFIAAAAFAQTAGDDIKDAGKSAGNAAVKTGSATAKVTAKGAKKTGHLFLKGSKTLVSKTGEGLEKGGEKLRDVGK